MVLEFRDRETDVVKALLAMIVLQGAIQANVTRNAIVYTHDARHI
ncbi:MAG: hypothetical protein OXI36_04925 [Gammaproteobacteria bacterium]|nr:hypothetical protein [Gammaproteobacteria bacterium]MDE0402751.1 hypothetical protein [Gammaproteobacteria bacterium]